MLDEALREAADGEWEGRGVACDTGVRGELAPAGVAVLELAERDVTEMVSSTLRPTAVAGKGYGSR